MKKWRFIDTKTNSASYNMAVDEMLLNSYNNHLLPIFRLYSWEPSVSFGRFSKIKNNINIAKLNNFSYARRITGGGILIHDRDISYTIILPRSYLNDMGVKKSYSYLCSFLIEFYKKLSLAPSFSNQSNLKCKSSEICLEGNEPYDIVIENKKLGGNAQRYTKQTLFQHGSIPLKIDKKLFETLFLDDLNLNNTTTLYKIGIKKEYDELKKILKDVFCKTFDCQLIEKKFTEEEKTMTQHLIRTKYSHDSWNIDGNYNH